MDNEFFGKLADKLSESIINNISEISAQLGTTDQDITGGAIVELSKVDASLNVYAENRIKWIGARETNSPRAAMFDQNGYEYDLSCLPLTELAMILDSMIAHWIKVNSALAVRTIKTIANKENGEADYIISIKQLALWSATEMYESLEGVPHSFIEKTQKHIINEANKEPSV